MSNRLTLTVLTQNKETVHKRQGYKDTIWPILVKAQLMLKGTPCEGTQVQPPLSIRTIYIK